jgi:uncharacterized phage-associated protein
MGGLFISNFKRKEVTTDNDIRRLVYYIHSNPVESNFAETIQEWQFSSYSAITSDGQNSIIPICIEEIIRVFNDIENFVFMHEHPSRV